MNIIERLNLQKNKSTNKIISADRNTIIDNYIIQKAETREQTEKEIAEIGKEIAAEIEKQLKTAINGE